MKTASLQSGKQMNLSQSTSLIAYVPVLFFSGMIPKKIGDHV